MTYALTFKDKETVMGALKVYQDQQSDRAEREAKKGEAKRSREARSKAGRAGALLGMFAGMLTDNNAKFSRAGHWIELDSCMTLCSECGGYGCGTKFCANCGAEMS